MSTFSQSFWDPNNNILQQLQKIMYIRVGVNQQSLFACDDIDQEFFYGFLFDFSHTFTISLRRNRKICSRNSLEVLNA
jgi:hypothetical protein